MVLFIVIAAVSILGVLFRQTYLRFETATAAEGKIQASSRAKTYIVWLGSQAKTIVSGESYKNAKVVLGDWTRDHYPGWLKWIFIGLGSNFAYLAASGLFFAVFIPRGMFGFPLLGHVMVGGLFALSLAATLLWRGRDYRLDKAEEAVFEGFSCPVFKNLSKAFLRKILFWAFALFGVVQAATALGSMLPIFTYETQQAMIVVHRYSALAIVLTAIVFVDITFVPQRRP
jgi:hypothetical protein